jgi:hypothetical protein
VTALSPLLACLTLAGRLAGWAQRQLEPPDPLVQLDQAMTRLAAQLDPLYDHDERTRP